MYQRSYVGGDIVQLTVSDAQSRTDSQGSGDVAGQSPQAPGRPDADSRGAGPGTSFRSGGSAGQPGQLQGA